MAANIIVNGIAIPLTVELGKMAGAELIDALKTNLAASSISVSQPHPGAVWITSADGSWGSWKGQVLSAYYHPSKKHTATTVGKLGTKQSVAEGGHWAVSLQTRGLGGNKANYDTL